MTRTLTDWTTEREIRTLGPRPGVEALRDAYLELLKLTLCDLGSARTISVGRTEDGQVFSRELSGEQLQLRTNGMDWPLNGLTMVGLLRLDDLQRCVESVVADRVEGDLIEAGTWRGGAAILMRATLDSLGADERAVWVADSFQGFPAQDADGTPENGEGDDLGAFDFLAVSLDEVKGHFARFGCERGVNFVPGLFQDTLPGLGDRRWSVIRLDGDTYEATWVSLESLYPGLSTGGYLIVDDYRALDECRRAVDDFRGEHGITEPLQEVDWTCVRWRRETQAPVTAHRAGEPPTVVTHGPPAAGADRQRPDARVPSGRELELEAEVGALRERLREAEAERERQRAGGLRRLASWVRRKVRGA